MLKVSLFQSMSTHYSIEGIRTDGMDYLLNFFNSDDIPDHLNLVFFSTEGIHGSATTIEDVENRIRNNTEGSRDITFLILQPARVSVKYGVCTPVTMDHIHFLKRIRAASHEHISKIGIEAVKI